MKVWVRLLKDVRNASGRGKAGDTVYWPEATVWPLLGDAAELVEAPVVEGSHGTELFRRANAELAATQPEIEHEED